MGEVYLAEDERIEQQVAFKVVRSELASYPNSIDASHLFKREARTIARLDHPNILPLFDFGEEIVNGISLAYLVMPYRPAGSLDKWLRARSELLAPRDVAHFVYQAADALQHAHDQQIIHRDVKPSNFLLRLNKERPDQPDLLLADFGVAMFFNATASMSQSTQGTPNYMPPEQWAGTAVPATDQYALAVMAYRLLVGHLPFEGRQEEVMYKHFNAQAQPPSALNERLATSLDNVVLRALAKKPEERFETILTFARAFQEVAQLSEFATLKSSSTTGHEEVHITSTPEEGGEAPLAKTTAQGMDASVSISAEAAPEEGVTPVSDTALDEDTIRVAHLISGKHAVPVSQVTPEEEAMPALDEALEEEQALPVADLEPEGHTVPLSGPEPEGRTIPLSGPEPEGRTIPISYPTLDEGHTIPVSNRFKIKWSDIRKIKLSEMPRSQFLALIGLVILLVLIGIDVFSVARIQPLVTSGFNATATSYVKAISRAYAATRTVQVDATMAVTSNPYVADSGPFMLYDPLVDNHSHLWEEGDYKGGYCKFMAGAYHASTTEKNTITSCINETSYTNFVFEIQMTMIKGDYGGIIFRSDHPEKSYYYFVINEKGSYQVNYLASTGYFATIVSGDAKSVINGGANASNLIAVVARGRNFDLFVNKHHITNVTGGLYRAGFVGIAASEDSNATEAMFHNARIWKL